MTFQLEDRGAVFPVRFELSLTELSDLITALGNASGFLEGVLVCQDLSEYQRNGGEWVQAKIRGAMDLLREKEPVK